MTETLKQTAAARRLKEAVWQVLDDFQEGTSCCPAAAAELRVAFEPFRSEVEYDK